MRVGADYGGKSSTKSDARIFSRDGEPAPASRPARVPLLLSMHAQMAAQRPAHESSSPYR